MSKASFNHRWRVWFKNGGGQALVYAESEAEARAAAVAEFRKHEVLLDRWGIDQVVQHVELVD